jgi:hypothetical protein
MKLASKPVANPAVMFQEAFDGEVVLVNTDTAAAIVLNPTGVVAWRLMDGSHSVDDIVASIKRQFKGVPDTVFEDVQALVTTLAEDGFVGYELLSLE